MNFQDHPRLSLSEPLSFHMFIGAWMLPPVDGGFLLLLWLGALILPFVVDEGRMFVSVLGTQRVSILFAHALSFEPNKIS